MLVITKVGDDLILADFVFPYIREDLGHIGFYGKVSETGYKSKFIKSGELENYIGSVSGVESIYDAINVVASHLVSDLVRSKTYQKNKDSIDKRALDSLNEELSINIKVLDYEW